MVSPADEGVMGASNHRPVVEGETCYFSGHAIGTRGDILV